MTKIKIIKSPQLQLALKKNLKNLKLLSWKLLILYDSNIFLFLLPGLSGLYLKLLVQSCRNHFCCALYVLKNEYPPLIQPHSWLEILFLTERQRWDHAEEVHYLKYSYSQSFNLRVQITVISCLINANLVSLPEAILDYLHIRFLGPQ